MTRKPSRRFDPAEHRRPRRLEEVNTAEIGFPLVWLVIGGLAAMIVIGLVGLGVVNIVRQGAITPTPTLTAPLIGDVPAADEATQATSTPAQVDNLEPTPLPTSTPLPPATPVPTLAPRITTGNYVTIVNTEGLGVRIRPGPRRDESDEVLVAPEETIFLVLGGPSADLNQEDYIWWNVRWVEEGTEGWIVEDFMAPAQAP